MADREYIPFYRSFYEQISACDDPKARLEMYEVLLDYAFNKNEPDFDKVKYNGYTYFFWLGARPILRKSWAQYENGCKGGAPKGNTNNKGKRKVNPKLTQSQANKDIDNDNEKDNDKEGERDNDTFRPPSFEDVVIYYSTHANGALDDGIAKKFVNYYAARGWKMSNGATMADWRAAFDSWCDKEKEFNHNKHTCNNENAKSTTKQCDTELGQLREWPSREAGNNGESAGIDDAVW